MSFLVNTEFRSQAIETMDDFSLEGEMFRDTLDKLELINRRLGGNRVTINGLRKLIKDLPKDRPIKIVDLGCGHGDILRDIAKLGRKEQRKFQLIGVDANQDAVQYSNELSVDFPEIEFKTMDVFSATFKELQFDIALCTLFMHHFKDKELKELLSALVEKTSIGIVINDLHRHKIAYLLFQFLGLFIKNKMVREDGLISILRAFKRKDLERLSSELNLNAAIRWKWAFRYQWIIRQT